MKIMPLMSLLACVLFASTPASANEWGSLSAEYGELSAGATFDYYNDFFPAFLGAGIHKFHNSDEVAAEDAASAFLAFGFYTFHAKVGLTYVRSDISGSEVGAISTVGGSYAFDEGKHFAVGPYLNFWGFESGTEREAGIKFTYSPSRLRP